MRRGLLLLALMLAVPTTATGAQGVRIVGKHDRSVCAGTTTVRWTGGTGTQRVTVRRDTGRYRLLTRTTRRQARVTVTAGSTVRVRIARQRVVLRGTTCPQATPATWQAAWGDALNHYLTPVWLAGSTWKAHPVDLTTTQADATYRFIVRPTVSGSQVRLRLANSNDVGLNATGSSPVTFAAVTVGERDHGAAIVPGTLRQVRFDAGKSVTLKPGASVVSDPVELDVQAQHDLAVSVQIVGAQSNPPLHPQSRATQFATAPHKGDHTQDETAQAFTTRQEPILWLDEVDVRGGAQGVLVAIGDSVTDGDDCGVKSGVGVCDASDDKLMDTYATYPDRIAQRLPTIGVINKGVNGAVCTQIEQVLDGDVLALPGVTDVIVECGTNDLTFGFSATAIEQTLTQIADRLHAHHIHVIGATLVPRSASLAGLPATNTARAQINQWIRTTDRFDGVLDIAKAVGTAADDNVYAPGYDSGDGLHPNNAGDQAIAAALDTDSLRGQR